jgi:hypothetical protein
VGFEPTGLLHPAVFGTAALIHSCQHSMDKLSPLGYADGRGRRLVPTLASRSCQLFTGQVLGTAAWDGRPGTFSVAEGARFELAWELPLVISSDAP